jgi:hypothetical protein
MKNQSRNCESRKMKSAVRLAFFFCFLVSVFCFQLCGASDWYISTNGSGNGSITNPWSIALGLTNSAVVKPGDTIWLRGGTYGVGTNVYSARLIGTSNSPIVVRQYPSERAIINGRIVDGVSGHGSGSYTTFWGFEIMNSGAHTNSMEGPGVVGRPGGISISGIGQKVINMVIHDTAEACIGAGTTASNNVTEIYGCIVWGCGIYDTNMPGYSVTNPVTRGSPLYLQNKYNTFTVSDNISSRNFTTGMKAYAQEGYANGFIFTGNVFFGCPLAGIEVECFYNSITNTTVINNFTYHCDKTPMGYFSSDSLAQHYSLVYSNNYIVGAQGAGGSTLWLKRWRTMQVVGNTVITTCKSNDWYAGTGTGSSMGGHFIELYPVTNAVLSYTINSNAYYGGVEQDGAWYDGGIFHHTYTPFVYHLINDAYDGTNGLQSFTYWQNSHGFDLNSTYTTNLPTANVVVVRPNKYEVGRGHIVIFNWQSNSTVSVKISSLGLTNGQRFEVRDAQNYLGTPCITTNYNTAQPLLSLPLTLTNMTVLTPVGDINPATFPSGNPDVHTASLFNVFVVLPIHTSLGTALLPPTGLAVVR